MYPKCIKGKCPVYQEIRSEAMLRHTIYCPCMYHGRCTIITELLDETSIGINLASDAWERAKLVLKVSQNE